MILGNPDDAEIVVRSCSEDSGDQGIGSRPAGRGVAGAEEVGEGSLDHSECDRVRCAPGRVGLALDDGGYAIDTNADEPGLDGALQHHADPVIGEKVATERLAATALKPRGRCQQGEAATGAKEGQGMCPEVGMEIR